MIIAVILLFIYYIFSNFYLFYIEFRWGITSPTIQQVNNLEEKMKDVSFVDKKFNNDL